MKRSLLRNLSILTLADMWAKFLPLMTFPLVTRALGPAVFGQIAFATAATGLFALAASPGLVPWGIREAARNAGRESEIATTLLRTRFAFAAGAFLALSAYGLALAPDVGAQRLLIILYGFPLLVAALDLGWLFIARQRFGTVALANVLAQTVYAGLLLLLVRQPSDAWVLPIAALAAAGVSAAILMARASRMFATTGLFGSGIGWRRVVGPSLLLGVGSLMSLTYDKFDILLLGYFRSGSEVGIYAAAYRLMGLAMSFHPILAQVFFPSVAEESATTGTARHAATYLRALWFVGIPILVGGLILTRPLCGLVLGRQYTGTPFLFALLLPNVLLGGLASYYSSLRLMANNRNRAYVASVTAGAGVNVGLNLVLIPTYGPTAAAVTTCLAQGTVALTAAWLGRHLPGPQLLGEMARPAGASLVMALVLLGLASVLPTLFVGVPLVIGGLSYLGAWWLLGQLNGNGNRPAEATIASD